MKPATPGEVRVRMDRPSGSATWTAPDVATAHQQMTEWAALWPRHDASWTIDGEAVPTPTVTP